MVLVLNIVEPWSEKIVSHPKVTDNGSNDFFDIAHVVRGS